MLRRLLKLTSFAGLLCVISLWIASFWYVSYGRIHSTSGKFTEVHIAFGNLFVSHAKSIGMFSGWLHRPFMFRTMWRSPAWQRQGNRLAVLIPLYIPFTFFSILLLWISLSGRPRRGPSQIEVGVDKPLHPVLLGLRRDPSKPIPARVAQQRSAAREALSRCAALCGGPHDRWEQDANGAPLPNGGFYWSISHKPLMVAAVIADRPVGIDVEHIKPRGNEGLWDRLADGAEWAIAGGRSWEMFFRLWTAKEATLKANARGIGGLDECRIVALPDDKHVVLTYRGSEWRVEQFYHQHHVVAVTAGDREVRWHVQPS